MMKQGYLLALVTMMVMTGCAYKNEAIELSSYKGQYVGRTTQDKTPIALISVTDVRPNPMYVGYVVSDNVATAKLYSYVNFADRYKEALNRALQAARFTMVQKPSDTTTLLTVAIKEIHLTYNDTKKLDENLHGKVVVEVTVKKGEKSLIRTFTQEQGKWIKPSYTSKDIEPFLDTLFVDNINQIVTKLAE
ncbi:MAG: hypothetical protein KU29_13720 [Sulfurovum sp. FS06-10]|nr:MAG: hypothetical protein KU29_13720 [Sulfurovum sp. FS06-10]